MLIIFMLKKCTFRMLMHLWYNVLCKNIKDTFKPTYQFSKSFKILMNRKFEVKNAYTQICISLSNCSLDTWLMCLTTDRNVATESLTDREVIDVSGFLYILWDQFIFLGRRDVGDVRVWTPDPSRDFSCHSYFHILCFPVVLFLSLKG